MSIKCGECGGAMQTRRGVFKHKALGLANVVLANVEIRTCKECGEQEVVIPAAEKLRTAIVHAIVTKPGRLSGEEVRYLRKFIGWSGSDFARHFGVEPGTVSRWENEHEKIGPAADRLLRLSVTYGRTVLSYDDGKPEHVLDAIKRKDAKPVRLKLRLTKRDEWATVPA